MSVLDASRSFPGGLDDLVALHAWLDGLQRDGASLEEKTFSRIRLALAEAFSNAVLHAHNGKPGLPVVVRIRLLDGREPRIRLDVTDRGAGFHVRPPVPAPEHAESGRGLMILHKLAERIEYENNTLSLWLHSPPH